VCSTISYNELEVLRDALEGQAEIQYRLGNKQKTEELEKRLKNLRSKMDDLYDGLLWLRRQLISFIISLIVLYRTNLSICAYRNVLKQKHIPAESKRSKLSTEMFQGYKMEIISHRKENNRRF